MPPPPLSTNATKNRRGVGINGCFERQGVKDIPAAFAELYPTTFGQFAVRFVSSLFRFGVLAALATHILYFISCNRPASGGSSRPTEAYLPQGIPVLSALRFSPTDTIFGFLPAPAFLLGAAFGVAHLLAFVVCHTFFYVCTRTGALAKYRLERAPSTVPPPSRIRKAARSQGVGLVTMQPVLGILVSYLLMSADEGGVCAAMSFWENATLFGLAIVMSETVFYCVHRLMHEVPFLYRNIHKKHHEFIATVSVAAEYAHPLEDLFAAVIPTLGIFLLPGLPPMHPLFAFVWIASRAVETYETHSGYCFHGSVLQRLGLLHSSHMAFHDFHHTANKGNYGTSILWDYLLGTDASYAAKLAVHGV